MKHSVRFVILALTAVLVSVTPGVEAFTLGELRGVALIGRALDVSVRIQAGPAEDLTAACFSAEVFHADTRQATPLVSVTPTTAGEALVRVQSTVLVNEPVVSLELRSNCGAATTRRYVLLADMAPARAALPTADAPPAPAPAAPIATVVVLPAAAPVPATTPTAATHKRSKAAAADHRPRDPAKQKPGKQVAKNVMHSGARAVLKLDPLDLFSDRIAALDATMLFEPTADALQQARKVTDLQNDVQLLRQQAAKYDAQLLDLKAQLQLAQSQQPDADWIYALVGTALVGLLALAWRLWQRRHARQAAAQTWHDSLPWAAAPATPKAATPAAQSAPLPAAPIPPEEPESTVPTPLNAQWHAVASDAPNSTQAAQPRKPSSNPASGLAGLHSFSLEPILDIRQQAEFFVSLGQTDRALNLLMEQIATSTEPNPFIYLDLLALLHSLGMKAEFREYRLNFNLHFSGAMPDFAGFYMEGRELLDYPDVLKQLVQDWPSAKTLVLLSAWIFRNPRASSQASFDLAAFRDLLMLHALAEEVAVDLPWDTAAHPWPYSHETAVEPNDAAASPALVADLAQVPVSAAPAVEKPDLVPDINAQVLDMDFSMFDTGTFGLAPSTRTQPLTAPPLPPPADTPRARWPTKDPG